MYQILSQLVRFCRLYIKKHFDVFLFGSQCICGITRATFGDIVNDPIEQLDLENMDIAIGILLLCALELEILCEPQMTTNGLHTSGFCTAILDIWNMMYYQ